MSPEKVQQVITLYRKKFEELGIGKDAYPHEKLHNPTEHGLEHCHYMLDQMDEFIKENRMDKDRMDKVFRWLGFIQGVLWLQEIYTVKDLKNHNKKDPE